MNVNDVHSLCSCSNVSFLASQKKWTCWWRYFFLGKTYVLLRQSLSNRSGTMLATQFWVGNSPPVRERGRLGGGGTGGTFCDVRLATLSKFLEMKWCFIFYVRRCSLNLSASHTIRSWRCQRMTMRSRSFFVCLLLPSFILSFIHSCIVSHFVALSFFGKVLPETCSRIKTPNARKSAIPSIIELSRGQLLVILVCKFE